MTEINTPTGRIDAGKVTGNQDPKRRFRDAWHLKGQALTCDMSKAREIHRDRLRRERAPLLQELDAQWFMADDKTAVDARKQKLRDVTKDPRIDAAQTPEALHALTLDALIS